MVIPDADAAMQTILLIGLNHKTAPVTVRECLAFSREDAADAVDALRRLPGVGEVVLISTCNRVEVLLTTAAPAGAGAAVRRFLAEFKQVPPAQFEDAIYVHADADAVRHMFRVAASLDSMVLGEPQILGQIKDAYALAVTRGSTGVVLNRLLHRTFFTAKRVRNETGIGDHAVSISYAAIELGRKIFGELTGKKVLLVGAGEMAELAVEHLLRNRTGTLEVANRTFSRGLALARRYQGTAIRFEEIPQALSRVDIIISSTGAPDVVVRAPQVKAAMRERKNRPLFFIDIAVPRDIDADINRINNAYVYDIDDLRGVVDHNIEDRQREAVKAERIVDEAVIRFQEWRESLAVVPTIVSLRRRIETLVDAELHKTLAHLDHLSAQDRSALLRMKDALVSKMLHHPIRFLKSNGTHSGKPGQLDMVRKLFQLDDETTRN